KKQKIIDRFQVEVDKHNVELDHVAQIKVFRLVPIQWTPENGMLSPTQKLKRKVVINEYSKVLDEIYEKN
ncbi:MAG: long-chain fatty acid--CoA ligase, partial [Bacteroidota bacterium]